jgi:hypothetical protein
MRPLPPWARRAAAAAVLTLALGVLQGTMLWVGIRSERTVIPGLRLERLVLWQALGWTTWALLTPAILALGARVRPQRRLRWLAVHVPAAVACAALFSTGMVAVSRLVRPWGTSGQGRPFAMEVVGHGTSFVHLSLLAYFGILGAGYALDYYGRFRERERLAAGLEARLATARLEALRLQLQPHFLFNTLHTAAGLVRQGENDAAVETLARLSDLLRTTLDGAGRQLVPLAEELRLADLYLGIQRVRFSDRLRLEREVDETLLEAPVPPFVLQPLLENAVRHGIGRRAAAGTLRLVAAREGRDRLRLEVHDDGVGLAEGADGGGTGESGRGAAPEAGPRSAEGVGLGNTRARLAALYGGAAALELLPRAGGGAIARLTLPLAGAPAAAVEGAA